MAAAAEKKAGEKKAPAKKDRPAIKARLKALKKSREEAKESKDADALARIRRRYRRATHALRRTAPPKAKAAKKE
jgi:hypothetical protein